MAFNIVLAALLHLATSPVWATDLGITKTADKSKYQVGDTITFTVTVDNTSTTGGGPYDSPGTIVVDDLPSGLEFQSAEASNNADITYDAQRRQVRSDMGTVDAYSTEILTVVATATEAGDYTNHAYVEGDLYDPDPGNNGDTCSYEITGPASGATPLIVDGFSHDISPIQVQGHGGPFPVSIGTTVEGSMLGGECDALLILDGVENTSGGAYFTVEQGRAIFSQDATSTGRVILCWDGVDGDAARVVASSGLGGGVDLTGGGTLDGIEIEVVRNDLPLKIAVLVYAGVENSSELTLDIPATDSPAAFRFPFGDLVSQGEKADLTRATTVIVLVGAMGSATGEVYLEIDSIKVTSSQGPGPGVSQEPRTYPIENIIATASSSESEDYGPQNTINGSGLDAEDLHSTAGDDMWLSDIVFLSLQPTWIQYEFDQVYRLREMWVWNHNTEKEGLYGAGFKDVTIEYSPDGTTWTVLDGVHQFAQAPGASGYAHNTIVGFDGVDAQYVKLTVLSNWGGWWLQYGLSEVRFFGDLLPACPAGSDGYMGVREVIDNGEIWDQDACYESLASGLGVIVDYDSPVLNIWDGGKRGHFGDDDELGVVVVGHREPGEADHLSLFAQGAVRIPAEQAGVYTFGINSDDGFTLQFPGRDFSWAVNGELVDLGHGAALCFQGGRSAEDTFGLIHLPAGDHPFWLTFHESDGGTALEFFAAPGPHEVFDPDIFRLVGQPSDGTIPVPGLAGAATMTATRPGAWSGGVIDTLDTALDALAEGENRGTNSYGEFTVLNHIDPEDGGALGSFTDDVVFCNNTPGNDDDFAVKVTGWLEIPEGGPYQIGLNSDDGAYLRILGQQWDEITCDDTGTAFIADDGLFNDSLTVWGFVAGEIYLDAGPHEFEVVMFERGGGAFLEWFGRGTSPTTGWPDPGWHLIQADGAGIFQDAGGLQLQEAPGGNGDPPCTRTRPVPPATPVPNREGVVHGGDSDCQVAARVGIKAFQVFKDPKTNKDRVVNYGVTWASTQEGQPPTPVWIALDEQAVAVQEPVPEGTGPYRGTMTVDWSYAGQDIDGIALRQGKRNKENLEVSGTKTSLPTNFKREHRKWETAKRAFRFPAPGDREDSEPAVCRVTWDSKKSPRCPQHRDVHFVIHWFKPPELGAFARPPQPTDRSQRDDVIHQSDDYRRHTKEEGEDKRNREVHYGNYVVTPVRYVWDVAPNRDCCDDFGKLRVVQFARAVLDSDANEFDRVKPWGLDITEAEKEQARQRKPPKLDPTFTTNPGVPPPDGDTRLDRDSDLSLVSHWDGPGMTEGRYRQLLHTPGRHVLHQQFFAFLVCWSGPTRQTPSRILENSSLKVLKAVVYTVTWTFVVPESGPSRATVSATVNARRDVNCEHSLGEMIRANGLEDGFNELPAAELDTPRNQAEHATQLSDVERWWEAPEGQEPHEIGVP